jgi:hypothetical protein
LAKGIGRKNKEYLDLNTLSQGIEGGSTGKRENMYK